VKSLLVVLLLTAFSPAQTIAPLTEPPQHVRKHHEKEHQERVARFNEILSHPQDVEETAWEWYAFTDDSGWVVGGYNWAVVKWNQGFHTTALDYFKWLSNHCEDHDGTHEPEVCRLSKLAVKANR
jgi:hypothetical protein